MYTGGDRAELNGFAPSPLLLLCTSVLCMCSSARLHPLCQHQCSSSDCQLPQPARATGHSCFAHLGISVKMRDCAQLTAPCCLHVNVNSVPSTAPSKCAPSASELCQKRVIDCGPCQQPKEIMAENRLCLKMVVGCQAAQRDSLCCPITDSPLQHRYWFVSWFLCCVWKYIIKC